VWSYHSHPSSAEVKNAWSYTSTPQYIFMSWCSVKSTGTSLPSPLPYKIMPSDYILRQCDTVQNLMHYF